MCMLGLGCENGLARTGFPADAIAFNVPGLPAAGLLGAASLRFASYDADHPGEEGTISVNGGAAIDLPANVGWDNASGMSAVDVTGISNSYLRVGADASAPANEPQSAR